MEYGRPVLLGVYRREIRVVLGGGEAVGTVLRGPGALFLFPMTVFLQKERGRYGKCVASGVECFVRLLSGVGFALAAAK